MKYNPKNPLTDDELDKLGKEDFEGFLEYIDTQSEEKKRDALRKTGITKIKTNRDQWFD